MDYPSPPLKHHTRPERKYHPITSVLHTSARDPLLSRGVDRTKLNGFVNLVFVVFVVTNFREFMSNLLKYGLLVRWWPSPSFLWRNSVAISCIFTMILLAFISYTLERNRGFLYAAARKADETRKCRVRASLTKREISAAIETQVDPTPMSVRAGSDTGLDTGKLVTNSDKYSTTQDQGDQSCTDKDETESDGEFLKGQATAQSQDEERDESGQESPSVYESVDDYAQATPVVKPKPNVEVPPARSRSPSRNAMEILAEIAVSHELLQKAAENAHVLAVTTNCILMLAIPYATVTYTGIDEASSLAVLLTSLTWLLKLISFHHVLHDIRMCLIEDNEHLFDNCPSVEEREEVSKYPHCLSYRRFFSFLLMPTICFQLHFPLKDRIDWFKAGRIAVKLVICCITMKILIEQYVSVIVTNTFQHVVVYSYSPLRMFGHLVERILKLSLPTLYVWLLMFLAFFHFWLQLLAEITRFEDCLFYEDWWNATGFGEYWRRWNLPVHHFCMRHIYKPLLNRGTSKVIAGQTVFALSALAHEYLVCAPLKVQWTGLVFVAFMLQTPLALITDAKLSKKHPTFGNVLFWVVFSFTGQPFGVVTFYYLWAKRRGISLIDEVPPISQGHRFPLSLWPF